MRLRRYVFCAWIRVELVSGLPAVIGFRPKLGGTLKADYTSRPPINLPTSQPYSFLIETNRPRVNSVGFIRGSQSLELTGYNSISTK